MLSICNLATLGFIASLTNADQMRDTDGTPNRRSVKRGTTTPQAIQFVDTPFGTVQDLGAPLDLRFGCKIPGQDDGSYVVSNYNSGTGLFDYVKTGAGATALYTANPGCDTAKLNNLLGYDPFGFAECTEVRTEADSAGSLNQKTFVLRDKAGSVGVWYDLNNAGGATPAAAVACARAIKITTVNTGDPAATVASKTATKLATDAQFTNSVWNNGDLVTITDSFVGPRTAAADADTGFAVSRWIAGSLPGTMANQPFVDLDAEWYWNQSGVVTKSQTFTIRFLFDVNNGQEGFPQNATPAFPAPGTIVTFSLGGPIADLTPAAAANVYLTNEPLLGLFTARILAGAGGGAYAYNASLSQQAPKPGALAFINIEFPASANPTVNIRNGDPATGTILATVTNPAPAAAAYWAGIFFYNGVAWKKFFAAFQ